MDEEVGNLVSKKNKKVYGRPYKGVKGRKPKVTDGLTMDDFIGLGEYGELVQLRNSRIMSYDIKIFPQVNNITRHLGYNDLECLNVIVSNLISATRKEVYLIYPRNVSNNPVNSKRKISTKRIIKAVKFLEEQGYIENFKGLGSVNIKERTCSYIQATELFKTKFMNDVANEAKESLLNEIEKSYNDTVEVIFVRDENKKELKFKRTTEVIRMDNTLRRLNEINTNAIILDKDGNRLYNAYNRIFNGDFSSGGRFFRADVLSIKNKPDYARLHITINGSAVHEVDFVNMHFRIASALHGYEEYLIPDDIYAVYLPEDHTQLDRSVFKLAVNILFNCSSERQALGAIQDVYNQHKQEISKKGNFTIGKPIDLLERIKYNIPQFKTFFCRKDGFGLKLQNEESHIANAIINRFVELEQPLLPIHDSFLVDYHYTHDLCVAMVSSFRERYNIDHVIPLKIKYLSYTGIEYLPDPVLTESLCVCD